MIGILALAIGVLIANMFDDGEETSNAVTPGGLGAAASEPEQAIIDYNTAWEEQDREALLAVVTDDFVEEYHCYTRSGDQVSVGSESWGATEAASYAARPATSNRALRGSDRGRRGALVRERG